MTDEIPEYNQIWLGLVSTDEADGYYPVIGNINTLALSAFSPKNTIGDYTKDAEDYISTLIYSDLSGGMNVEDMNEGSDTARCWTAFMDIRHPGKIGHNPRVVQLDLPSGASGTCYACRTSGGIPYFIFGTKIYGLKESDMTWYTGVTTTNAPVEKPVEFMGRIFIPTGSNGYTIVYDDVGDGSPQVDIYSGNDIPGAYDPDSLVHADPKARAFALYDQKIWALNTDGGIVWSTTGLTGSWTWLYNTAQSRYVQIQSGETPQNIKTFYDPQGNPALFVATDRAVYRLLDSGENSHYIDTPVQFPQHPDFGGAMDVWRPGEDLWIGAGMDAVRYTSANVVVPLSGLARDDGVPVELRGRIVDLEAETSELYATVAPSGDPAWSYDSQFGTTGTGNTNFDTPSGVAVDSSGNIYIVDTGNDRVKKHNSGGTYVSEVSITDPTAICIDSSDVIYVAADGTLSFRAIYSFDTSLNQIDALDIIAGADIVALATDNTDLYWATSTRIGKTAKDLDSTITSSLVSTLSITTPSALCIANSLLYVASQGTDQVVALTPSTMTESFRWGSAGTADGQFGVITAIAAHPTTGHLFVADSTRDDVQEFTKQGVFIARYGSTGTGNGQFTVPRAIAFNAAGSTALVADADRIENFDYNFANYGSTYPWIGAWFGTGWYGKYKHSVPGVVPNWACVNATAFAYSLNFGMDDGRAYRMKLDRFFSNPRQLLLHGSSDWATDGEIITSRFDAAMLGFYKVASHMVVFLEGAKEDSEYITIEYQTDSTTGWLPLGTVETDAKTYLPFGVDATSSFSSGVTFNWIQFRIRSYRGSDEERMPLIKSIVFCYLKIPQNASAYNFTIAFPKGDYLGRSGAEIRDALNTLITAKSMVRLRIPGYYTSSSGTPTQLELRGYLTALSGDDVPREETSGQRAVNFIQIRSSES